MAQAHEQAMLEEVHEVRQAIDNDAYPPPSPEDHHHGSSTARLLLGEQQSHGDGAGETEVGLLEGEDKYVGLAVSEIGHECLPPPQSHPFCRGSRRLRCPFWLTFRYVNVSQDTDRKMWPRIERLGIGYDTGVISGTLVVIGEDLGHSLSDVEKVCLFTRPSMDLRD